MELEKVIIRTTNGLIVECELTPKTIEKLTRINLVTVIKPVGVKNNVWLYSL